MTVQFESLVSSIYPQFSFFHANHRDENEPIFHSADNDFDAILQSPLCNSPNVWHLFFQAMANVPGIQILLLATFQKMLGASDLHEDLPPSDKVMFLIQLKN
jgi:hypothetical protein